MHNDLDQYSYIVSYAQVDLLAALGGETAHQLREAAGLTYDARIIKVVLQLQRQVQRGVGVQQLHGTVHQRADEAQAGAGEGIAHRGVRIRVVPRVV